jgi:uncharacterized protein (DUF169 family)
MAKVWVNIVLTQEKLLSHDQITEDNDVFFIIDKWKKSLQLYHDELYNKIYEL